MKQHLSGGAMTLAGVLVLLAVWFWRSPEVSFVILGVTIGFVACVTGLIMLIGAWSGGKGNALLRLDHFLPFLRKKKQKETLKPPSWLKRVAQAVLPARLFSDKVTGKPGWVRKLFKRVGPTMLSAPFRRVVQGVCFVAFLWLFFYVCWPYSARPDPQGDISAGWQLKDVGADTGYLHLFHSDTETRSNADASSNASTSALRPTEVVYLVDALALDAIRGDMGACNIVATDGSTITLEPMTPLTDSQLETLLTSAGTWSLHENSPWPRHYADDFERKEWVAADMFLAIDPLVSLSTAVAARSWVWSLASAGAILIVCVLIPRGFCGYLCPLGTLIDMFDWTVSKRIKRFRVPKDGWWVHIKYYVLLAVMVSAVCGVLVSGFVAAIPVITRGMLFIGEPLQSGAMRGWDQVPPLNAGHFLSLALFFAVLGLGLLRPRFWCKYVCPSGAVFSLGNLFRISERKVESSCINCNKCVEICPFDAIKPDFTTRVSDCTLCQTCAGVCPTEAIKFVERGNTFELKVLNDPPTNETVIGRRGFVSLAAGTAAAVFGGVGMATATNAFGASARKSPPVRPPGSVPEPEFLQMCIRCGECFKACPYNVLQPASLADGWAGLWTPQVEANHAGCAPSCNACGQVCPTGAIRELPLYEKKVARMGLAILNEKTCLPIAGKEACQLCVDECSAAGYNAIEFTRVHTQVNEEGFPTEDSGFLAPVVLDDKCVGCGLCQMSCYRVNVHQKNLLNESAIIIEAGEGKEDRMMTGSYKKLREQEAKQRRATATKTEIEYYTPDATTDPDPFGNNTGEETGDDNPFGTDAAPAPIVTPEPESDNDPFGLGGE